MNFAIAASLDFPGKLLALVSTVWLGSRLPYISLSLTAGVSFLLVLILPAHLSTAARVTLSYVRCNVSLDCVEVLSMVSSFAISASFSMLWMWTAELMPTTLRNAGV